MEIVYGTTRVPSDGYPDRGMWINENLNGRFIPFRGILSDYKNAHCTITRTSAGCIAGLRKGIPSISEDSLNIANAVCERSLENVENPRTPDREQWINDLCYAEWSLKECEEGEPWRHLRTYIHE